MKRLQTAGEGVALLKVVEVGSQVIVVVVVEPFHGSVLDRPVHSRDLTAIRENSPPDCFRILMAPRVAPRVVGLGEPVFDPVGFADHVEAHRPGIDGVPVSRLLFELNTIGGQTRVNLIGHGLKHVLKERPGCRSVSCCHALSIGELLRPVDAHEQVKPFVGTTVHWTVF